MVEVAEQIDMALSIGQLLKNARLKANLSREDVADHLRLTKDVVKRIENDGYQDSDLTVFVRGYIRSYAKYVQLASEDVEAYFYSLGVVEQPQTVKPAKFVFNNNTTHSKSLRLVSLGVIASLVILALLWLFWQHNDSQATISTVATSPATTLNSATQTTQQANATAQPASLSSQFAKQSTTKNS